MSTLFVYVPSISGSTSRWDTFRARLAEEAACRDATFKVWPETKRKRIRLWTIGRKLDAYARRLSDAINIWDLEADRGRRYTSIVLVGSSLGGLVVRMAWLKASGVYQPTEAHPWANKVERMVLVAGLARGFVIDREPPLRRRFLRYAAVPLAALVHLTWRDALAGSYVVTNLRLAWMRHIALMNQLDRPVPMVVQLAGTNDEMLKQEDWRDAEQFDNGVYLSIPDARHDNVLSWSSEQRYQLLRDQFVEPLQSTTPEAVPDQAKIKNVAFVLHGIRTGVSGWVDQIEAKILAAGAGAWCVLTPTYGYFSALAFAIPFTRQRKVFWFLDQYSLLLAKYPRAAFQFIGHSNGTYLLARAMDKVPAVKFERAYLASSPVLATYPWLERLAGAPDQRQVGLIRSDRGSGDWIVGFLAEGLRPLSGFHDVVGGGGFMGFADLASAPGLQSDPVPGGHGAPLKPDRHDSIVKFAMNGDAAPPVDLVTSSGLVRWLYMIARGAVPLLLLGLLGGLGYGIVAGQPGAAIGCGIALAIAVIAAGTI